MTRRCTVLVLAAFGTLAAAAAGAATPIYRCGQTYSQMPCVGGTLLESSDSRTAAQRAEARRAAERERAQAEQLARERRRAEANAPVATGIDARPLVAAADEAEATGAERGARGAAPRASKAAAPASPANTAQEAAPEAAASKARRNPGAARPGSGTIRLTPRRAK